MPRRERRSTAYLPVSWPSPTGGCSTRTGATPARAIPERLEKLLSPFVVKWPKDLYLGAGATIFSAHDQGHRRPAAVNCRGVGPPAGHRAHLGGRPGAGRLPRLGVPHGRG